MKQGLKALGQSLLIIGGVGYGVVKALDALGPEQTPPQPVSPAPPDTASQQLNSLEERLIRMERSLQAFASPVAHPVQSQTINPQPVATHPAERTPLDRPVAARPAVPPPPQEYVTRAEFNAAMKKLSITLESGIEARFETQDRAVQSLRAMVSRTDELLEQVLESIESNSVPA